VASPPWQTWWAYALYAMSAASALFAYARMQSQKLEKEAEYSRKLEREVQTRTRELAERNSELEQANNKLQQASFTDSLTGLRNRRYLMSTISEDIALVDRYYHDVSAGSEPPKGKRPDFLFLIFDLDGFKEVNDTFGHAAGDRVLVQVRDILEKACRSSDTVIRWGGDEFLIVGRYADRRAAEILSDRIRSSVDQHPFQLGNDVEARLSCSIGFAYYPFAKAAPTLMNWEQVVAIADRALYIAKNSGRNAWVGVQDTPTTCDLSPEALVQQINDRIDRLVADGYLALHSSIDDEQELVWAWG
jgi:diguanylate cyclase (GGDEF)-like protein